jgi:hypothetical protein
MEARHMQRRASATSLVLFALATAGASCGEDNSPAGVWHGGTGGSGAGTSPEVDGGLDGSTPALVTGGAGGIDGSTGDGAPADVGPARFSFFVTSLQAMQELSGNPDGFGGDLRFGETGAGAGLRGADKICSMVAERSMVGAGAKPWRAFLSATSAGPNGEPVDAIDRVGTGPWYDRRGRLIALTADDLIAEDRPRGADPAIINDLPNEYGIPHHSDGAPGCVGTSCPDNHDVLTGTGRDGRLFLPDAQYTCDDWTSSAMSGRPWCGHSWPRAGSGINWMSAIAEGGCAPGINLMEQGGPIPGIFNVGTGGGYGAIYCFSLVP